MPSLLTPALVAFSILMFDPLDEVLTSIEASTSVGSSQDVVVEEVEFHLVSQESVICPPRYTPMSCSTEVEVEPNVFYRTCTQDLLGEEAVWVQDEFGNEVMILDPDFPRYSVELEKWIDDSNPELIDVKLRLTVKRNASGWGNYNYATRLDLCPYPYTHVQGNIYWDWKTAYEWYELNATPDDWLLYQEHGVNFNAMEWRTRGTFGRGGDLYFGCRKISGRLYNAPSPSFASRDIEWDGRLWKTKMPAEPVDLPANIKLEPPCDFDPSVPDSNDFAIDLQIRMSGRHVIASLDGEMLPKSEYIHIPNVVQFEAHAQFVIMDPVDCQPVYEEDGGDSSYDEVIP